MSTASIPVGQVQAAAPNPLGRVALIIGSAGLLISCLWTIIQLSYLNLVVARQGAETVARLHSTVSLTIYAVTLVLAIVSTIVGIKAIRRDGRSKVAAAMAIGMSGSALVGYLALLIANLVLALLQR